MKEQEVVETTFESVETGRKHTGKLIYVNGELKELKIYERTSILRRLNYLGVNNNPDVDITYRETN